MMCEQADIKKYKKIILYGSNIERLIDLILADKELYAINTLNSFGEVWNYFKTSIIRVIDVLLIFPVYHCRPIRR